MIARIPRLTIGHVWAFAALGSVLGYVCTMPIDPADFWHYLKSGQVMVQTRTILAADIFTFTIPGTPFVNLHWGSQVLFYLEYQAGGLELVAFLHAVVSSVAFGLVFATVHGRVRDLRVAAISTLVTFVVGAPGLALRPQGSSVLLFAATLWLVERRRVWTLPFVFLAWSNLHAAFPLGLAVVAIYGLVSDRGLGADGRVLLALAASAAVTLATPWGRRIYPAILSAETASRAGLIDEWSPITLAIAPGVIFFAVILAIVISRAITRTPWRVRELLVLVIFGTLALRERRAVVWFAIATAPIVADSLAAAAKWLTARTAASRTGAVRIQESGDRAWLHWSLTATFAAHLVFSTPWLKPDYPLLPAAKRVLLAPDTPEAMAEAIRGTPEARRVFSELTWGGYFIWALDSSQKVFYDPRVVMFPKQVMRDYLEVSDGGAQWQATLDRYDVDALALSTERQGRVIGLVRASPAWRLIYEDRFGAAFARTSAARDTLARD